MKLGNRRNQCPACGLYFGSLTAFDDHRVGRFGSGPLGTSPERWCLTEAEIKAAGGVKAPKGYWMGAGLPESVRKRFGVIGGG